MKRYSSFLIILVVAALATGCGIDLDIDLDGKTLGKQGRLAFAYADGGLFKHAMEKPVMLGAKVFVVISSDEALPLLMASAKDPSVVEVDLSIKPICCDRTDEDAPQCEPATSAECAPGKTEELSYLGLVTAKAVGKTDLRLISSDRKLFDEVTVEVARPDRVAIYATDPATQDQVQVSKLTLEAGDKVGRHVHATALDEDGRAMVGGSSLKLCSSDVKVAAFMSAPGPYSAKTDPVACNKAQYTSGDLYGRTPGKARLVVTAGGVSGSADVLVK